jgi:hypothetical protein
MMHLPFFVSKKSLQSKPTAIAPTLVCTTASDSSAEVRQLTLEEYSAVSGGPESEVGEGSEPD